MYTSAGCWELVLRRWFISIRVGCDIHGGTRALLYPFAGTHNAVYGTSPISGETYSAAPPDFYFFDAVGLRLGSYMGNGGGDGYLDKYCISTIDYFIWYVFSK